MTKIIAAVKGLGVADKDIVTESFYLSPEYDYTTSGQIPRGFQATQTLRVKIRDLDTVGDVLTAATNAGANQAGGISFGVDNPDAMKAKAREIAIEKAKAANMPRDTIQRAVEKGAGTGKDSLQQVVYEAFGPHGSTFIITTTTDNTNRSIAEIRLITERNGGKLASPGAVNYLFSHGGMLRIPRDTMAEEQVFERASALNAEDIQENEDEFEVYFPFDQLGKIEDSSAEEVYRPVSPVQLATKEQEEEVAHLMDLIDDHDDVQQVFTNIDFQYL
jgi:YebC/PmpR family DNA-binding regulatory protein